ncbi:MAG TPA: S1 RNA-binding domain-containing protein [Verrucomicrobiae bacterium]|nr:S1 RNA-binding domain-containing protein [Verrucomicrobiae bacterium]
MHHYEGKFSLLSTEQGGKKSPLFSSYRGGLFKIDGDHFGCVIELIGRTELKPGEVASVHVTFIAIELAVPRIHAGHSYEICEGAKLIGNLLIETDPWLKIDNVIHEGEEKFGIIKNTNWTRAILELDGEIATQLSSKNVGLQPWAEIAEKLKVGDRVKVKVEKIDRQKRAIEVSFLEKTQ